MRFVYSRQDMPDRTRAQENCFLVTNGLGGYASLSAAFSMTRADHGLLVSARTAPNDRVALVARMQETLAAEGWESPLSSQSFFDDTPPEDGWRVLSAFTVEGAPRWDYDVRGVHVAREVAMAYGRNAVAIRHTVENRTAADCTLTLRPFVLGFEKGHAPEEKWPIRMTEGCIETGETRVYLRTTGALTTEEPQFLLQAYQHDAPDGRPEKGLVGSACRIALTVAAGETATLCTVFSDVPCDLTAEAILADAAERVKTLQASCGLQDETARQLALAADAFIVDRASTGGRSIIAGYPFFGDWGRDTMIALPGCTLSTGRYEEAKSILRTFLSYEADGLVPNLFPEGGAEPMYNTVDAALLMINTIWLLVEKTGDLAFAREAWPVMQRVIAAYRRGTRLTSEGPAIAMEADGLIRAGLGYDQLTWMDVRIGDILPTPRHGKPVEINAYWYSALRIMDALALRLGEDAADYAALAEQVKLSFLQKFWMADKACLKDVISDDGSFVDEQIRCNQIWAVTMPFTMLPPEKERQVVDAVYAHLYTPCGLRTLSPEDAQYVGEYGGPQLKRDLAYHQGTVWPFPLGAYYLAYLKTRGNTPEAAQAVRRALMPMEATLREGCAGQLPEIYDGDAPSFSRGCFAQAWSVGEMLRVYEALEDIEG